MLISGRPLFRDAAAHAARRIAIASRGASSTDRSVSPDTPKPNQPQPGELTGSAKLFADAIEEESSRGSSRKHLTLTQGEIWTGDESQVDAVLRMLVDAHKPLRSGEGLKHDSADKKIKGMMKGLKMEPREGMIRRTDGPEPRNQHQTTLPPHLHRPWHSTYTGSNTIAETPKIKYGAFIQKRASGEDLSNILELQLPAGADGKVRSQIRDARKSHRIKARFESAREGAIDYRLGQSTYEDSADQDRSTDDEQFSGNRQHRGASVLGAQKGSASGMRAWAGLVEERIQRARESGFLKPTVGIGKPIPRDPEAGNPHIDSGELIMNRIVKRQGALPPWIELQNNLDAALSSFRNTLQQTYTTHLVRTVISTNVLSPLPPLHAIPDHDEAWEARERKFHDENVRQINDLVRRMNALAPAVVRRGLVTRDIELERIRGEPLKMAVWEEVKRRAEQVVASPPSSPYYMESESLARLSLATRRSLWTIAHPVKAIVGSRSGSSGSSGSRHAGQTTATGEDAPEGNAGGAFIVFAGLGLVGYAYFKRSAQNDSDDYIPVHTSKPEIVALSANEPTYGVLKLAQMYILEPILTFFRFIHLAILFGPVIITAPMLYIGRPDRPRRRGKPVAEDEENWGAVWWYAFLVRQMERAGPSFIKLGQWAASRADLFPASLCDLMGKLHSNGDPHSIRHTRRAIEGAFELSFDEIFEEFDEKPIGCGAIAQVCRVLNLTLTLGVQGSSAPRDIRRYCPVNRR